MVKLMLKFALICKIRLAIVKGVSVFVVTYHTKGSLGNKSVHGNINPASVFVYLGFGVPIEFRFYCSPIEVGQSIISL